MDTHKIKNCIFYLKLINLHEIKLFKKKIRVTFFFRLSIASAHAFLLVYSVTNPMSFLTVKQRFEEIREQRTDFQVMQ